MDNDWTVETRRKIEFLNRISWDGISRDDIDGFLNNFGDKEQYIGLMLLDELIYYSTSQEVVIIKYLLDEFIRTVSLSQMSLSENVSSEELRNYVDQLSKGMCFVPVTDSDPSDSSNGISGLMKKTGKVPKGVSYISPEHIPINICLGKEIFVFYDDLIGTGTQFTNFLKKDRFENGDRRTSLKQIIEKNIKTKWYYIVLGGCEKGIEKIEKEHPRITVIAGETFQNDNSVISNNNEYWEFIKSDCKEAVIKYIEEKKKSLGLSKFTMDIPVLYEHGRASNTALSLYWKETDFWQPLMRRY